MGILFLLIFFIISLCIVGLVLLQEGKGGGLTGMSTGMDGVMGAKNPLRRWTAYFFVAFVVMCLAINMYFHNREDAALPTGLEMNRPASALEDAVREVLPEGSLRPETEAGVSAPESTLAAPVVESAATEIPAAAPAVESATVETPVAAPAAENAAAEVPAAEGAASTEE